MLNLQQLKMYTARKICWQAFAAWNNMVKDPLTNKSCKIACDELNCIALNTMAIYNSRLQLTLAMPNCC